MLGSRPSTNAITDRPLANRWVGAPVRSAVPDVLLVRFTERTTLPSSTQNAKHVSVALLAVAGCASHRDPAFPFREAR